ncbi:MAG: hypothetical protein ACI8S6_000018 [Myxococcota bacterium]|jgi:hypothetical protein
MKPATLIISAGCIAAMLLLVGTEQGRWVLSAPRYSARYKALDDPVARAELVDALGRRESSAYHALLEEASRDPDVRVRFYAQSHMAPVSWSATARARRELNRLLCAEWFTEGRFAPTISHPVTSWYRFGASTWEGYADQCAQPTSAADWQELLNAHAEFVWINDARWFAARAAHQEGDADAVMGILDDAMGAPSSRGRWQLWANLRYYAVEQADTETLEGWLAQPERWTPQTTYALQYALGLHHFRLLEFSQAARIWDTLPETIESVCLNPHDPMEMPSCDLGTLEGWPAERAALAQRLASVGPEPEAIALALLKEQLGEPRGLFEAWLFVDNHLDYPIVPHLPPLEGSRAELIKAQIYHVEAGIWQGSFDDGELRWARLRDAARHYDAVAADSPHAAQATFLAALLRDHHDEALAAFPDADSPWAEHAAFWAEHVDIAGEVVYRYLPRVPLQDTPPSLDSITRAQPIEL